MNGELKGETKTIISQVCRKIAKNKSVDIIADELEEDISVIQPIYDIAIECAPDYNCEKIYQLLKEIQYV